MQMQVKIIILLILFSGIFACSSSPTSSQKSIDTRACNSISYGNGNVDILSMDDIYKKCMSDKRKIRKQQIDDAKKSSIIDFFLELFFSPKSGSWSFI